MPGGGGPIERQSTAFLCVWVLTTFLGFGVATWRAFTAPMPVHMKVLILVGGVFFARPTVHALIILLQKWERWSRNR